MMKVIYENRDADVVGDEVEREVVAPLGYMYEITPRSITPFEIQATRARSASC